MPEVLLYQNRFTDPPGRLCRRHWAHPRVLVGGNLNDRLDWEQLTRLGIWSVLNLDGRSEEHLRLPSLCEVPVADDGNPFSRAAVRRALSYARVQLETPLPAVRPGPGPYSNLPASQSIYVHCHIGVSRSPAFAYGILRWALDMSPEDAMAGLNSSGAEYGSDYLGYHPKHRTYIDAVESAISG
jgi:hypothetical protein